MKKMKREIPNFKNEDEEREFWATHSPLDYFDSKKFKKGFLSQFETLAQIHLYSPPRRFVDGAEDPCE